MLDPTQFSGFQWDEGNQDKSHHKHAVSPGEAEEVFFNRPLVVASDHQHSETENRYFALGVTSAARPLLVVFTTRRHLIRVISARPMSKRERLIFAKHHE